jgi:hypothetical protein
LYFLNRASRELQKHVLLHHFALIPRPGGGCALYRIHSPP